MNRTKRVIDIEQALILFAKLHSWRRVSQALGRVNGAAFSPGALAVAATRYRTEQGLPIRHYERNRTPDHVLAEIWRPPLPKPMKIVPDYRTNTARPA